MTSTTRRSRAIPPVVVTLTTRAQDPGDALELLRRVRAFGEEMRQAGLDVTIDGAVTLTVRPARPEVEPE